MAAEDKMVSSLPNFPKKARNLLKICGIIEEVMQKVDIPVIQRGAYKTSHVLRFISDAKRDLTQCGDNSGVPLLPCENPVRIYSKQFLVYK